MASEKNGKGDLLKSLQVIYGDMSPTVARLFARLPMPREPGPWRLNGTVRGPHSQYAETLPSSFPLRDLGPGNTLMAAATIPDPCFWSPHYPMLYELRVELLRDREVQAEMEWSVGLRRLGAAGRDLVLESRRWVLRAAFQEEAATLAPEEWREWESVLYTPLPDAAFCDQASRHGQMLVVELEGNATRLREQLRWLRRWPAVAFAVLPSEAGQETGWTELAPNMLLGQRFSSSEPIEPAEWCRVAFCDVDQPQPFAQRTAPLNLPVVAVRRRGTPAPLSQLRSDCDQLQRDLAPFGQFAGYLV